jgi:hypothetical protein
VSPEEFPNYWNSSQTIAGVQVALCANSPFLLGKELWRETRIALFEQATDTRSEELKAQGVRPRVWFGERWITSIFDLFEENVRYFPALLPIVDQEDPVEVLERGETPRLNELRLHNGPSTAGTVRSTTSSTVSHTFGSRTGCCRPDRPVVDTMANAAFYFGLTHSLATSDRPVWSQMSFSAAEENFHAAARHGIDATVYWPRMGTVPATELVLRRLLPLAHEGLDSLGVDADIRDRMLGIIEQRCLKHVNGATWQVDKGACPGVRRGQRPLRRTAPDGVAIRRADAQQHPRARVGAVGSRTGPGWFRLRCCHESYRAGGLVC